MKIPPLEKTSEAYSVMADQRITLSQGWAEVKLSDGRKTYLLEWGVDRYPASDNGSYWQGYAGYPAIAVLMLQRRLPYARIDWEALNIAIRTTTPQPWTKS